MERGTSCSDDRSKRLAARVVMIDGGNGNGQTEKSRNCRGWVFFWKNRRKRMGLKKGPGWVLYQFCTVLDFQMYTDIYIYTRYVGICFRDDDLAKVARTLNFVDD
ncbi:hypothetical protein RHMOL_Rhmol07G0159100 [Rhododendron molle]|uniref:Uncharacterized protein n=4 Tax=Rhododendron molle TaxID=49168 RepID=A0ACC0N303_RHOML|nr:hypothetical protein RHMOL_Rhmol07G0159100 [Rhododendron molle]KAI8546943.1 hypothetical protein RHMOL_Rhmol07G0159100 [Rhododendron molle]KAI8546944.1 hypothetical protein RHMOL_Rhmol07G0159100 [Rhododendron molle]KAI8546945.1 hypothetical protein RHMOL_Rhmol07G0159100 [Rhododendron molle]